jgi:hypothetical protein
VDAATRKLTFAGVGKPDVVIPLTVENTSTAVKKVSIAVSRFTTPTGESADAKVAPAAADIPPGGTQQFDLTATFLSAGTFTAQARVIEGSRRLTDFKIEVARTKAKPAVDIGDVAAIQETANLGHRSLGIPVTMKLYATGGAAAVPPPLLHSAIRKPKTDSPVGQATEAEIDVSQLPGSIEVRPGRPTDITFQLNRIGSPGRYDVQLRFAPSGFDVIEKAVTVYVRDPVWLACGLIAVGVVLSLLLHAYGGIIRPRMLVQQRVQRLLGTLRELENTPLEAKAKQLVIDVRRAITDRWNTLRDRRLPFTAQFDIYEEIVPALRVWSNLYSRTLVTRPESVRNKLLTILDDAAKAFCDASPDAAKVNAALTTLKQFTDTIRAEIEKELRQQLDALDKELRADARPVAARLRNALLLAGEKLARGQLEAAVGSFDAARLQYAAMLADDLRVRVENATPPAGMKDGEWRALREAIVPAVEKLKSISDADEAMALIARVMKEYLHTVAAALRSAANELGDEAKAKPMLDALDAVETSLDGDNLTAAWRHLEAARTAYQKAAVPVGQPMGEAVKSALDALAAAAGGAVGGGAFDIMTVIDVPPPAGALDLEGAEAATASRLTLFDILASGIVLVAAMLIGLQVLWIDNSTWGGWTSYLAAFGWGFALDQFTHAGITALRSK